MVKFFGLDTLAYFTRTFKDFRFSLWKENRRDGKIFVQTYREQWEIHYVKLFITAEMMQIEITPIYRRVIKQIVPIKTWLPIWTLRIAISFMWEPKSFIYSFFLHNHVQANLYISSTNHCIFLLIISLFWYTFIVEFIHFKSIYFHFMQLFHYNDIKSLSDFHGK